MIILDSNVLSALMKSAPDAAVVAWLDRQARLSVWISSVTVLEIRYGLQIMPLSKRRTRLSQEFEGLLDDIGHRVASFDEAAARHAAELMGQRHKQGRPVELRDTMIAGIVLSHQATLATRNTGHFSELPSVVNPWAA